MIIAIISILVFTLIVWFANKLLPFSICPICAGVFLTWIWMFVGISLGELSLANYQLPTTMLMGGTVVGLTFKLEQFIKPNIILVWKTMFIIFGFSVVYGLIANNWLVFMIGIILAIIITLIFRSASLKKKLKSEQVQMLEEK